VKQAVRLLSRFVLWSLLLVLVLGALVVLQRHVVGYDPAAAGTTELLARLVAAAREVLVISLLIAAGLSLFATVRLSLRPFFPVIILTVAWTALLLVGGVFWTQPDAPGVSAAPAVPVERVVRAGRTTLYALGREGTRLSPLVVHVDGDMPGFSLGAEGVIDEAAGTVIVVGRQGIEADLTAATTSYPAMVRSPESLQPLLRDIRVVNRVLGARTPGGPATGALNAIALGLLILGCWTFARLTRWPLFNALLVFLTLRGALWVISSIHDGALRELVTAVLDSSRLGIASAAVVAFVAAVLLIVLALLPSYQNWKREVGHD
jgi:hypothetical protein